MYRFEANHAEAMFQEVLQLEGEQREKRPHDSCAGLASAWELDPSWKIPALGQVVLGQRLVQTPETASVARDMQLEAAWGKQAESAEQGMPAEEPVGPLQALLGPTSFLQAPWFQPVEAGELSWRGNPEASAHSKFQPSTIEPFTAFHEQEPDGKHQCW